MEGFDRSQRRRSNKDGVGFIYFRNWALAVVGLGKRKNGVGCFGVWIVELIWVHLVCRIYLS